MEGPQLPHQLPFWCLNKYRNLKHGTDYAPVDPKTILCIDRAASQPGGREDVDYKNALDMSQFHHNCALT